MSRIMEQLRIWVLHGLRLMGWTGKMWAIAITARTASLHVAIIALFVSQLIIIVYS